MLQEEVEQIYMKGGGWSPRRELAVSWLHEAVCRTAWGVRLRLGSAVSSNDPMVVVGRGGAGGKQEQCDLLL